MSELPVLWSFRRCPYAMRARLAVQSAGLPVELREILLREKPEAFLADSASATVPALKHNESVLDESFDIMLWALERSDPESLLDMPSVGFELIAECDGPFKTALDHTKYAVRYPDLNEAEEREKAGVFLRKLDGIIGSKSYLFGDRASLADLAMLPFVRQFANTDRTWFDDQDWPHVVGWLDQFLDSERFKGIMDKFAPWESGQDPVVFPVDARN